MTLAPRRLASVLCLAALSCLLTGAIKKDVSNPPTGEAGAAFAKRHFSPSVTHMGAVAATEKLTVTVGPFGQRELPRALPVRRIGIVTVSLAVEHDELKNEGLVANTSLAGDIYDESWQAGVSVRLAEIAAERLQAAGFEVVPLAEIAVMDAYRALNWPSIDHLRGKQQGYGMRWWQHRVAATGSGLSPFTIHETTPPKGFQDVFTHGVQMQADLRASQPLLDALGVEAILSADARIAIGRSGARYSFYFRDSFAQLVGPIEGGGVTMGWSARFPKRNAMFSGDDADERTYYLGEAKGTFSRRDVSVPFAASEEALLGLWNYLWVPMSQDLASKALRP